MRSFDSGDSSSRTVKRDCGGPGCAGVLQVISETADLAACGEALSMGGSQQADGLRRRWRLVPGLRGGVALHLAPTTPMTCKNPPLGPGLSGGGCLKPRATQSGGISRDLALEITGKGREKFRTLRLEVRRRISFVVEVDGILVLPLALLCSYRRWRTGRYVSGLTATHVIRQIAI